MIVPIEFPKPACEHCGDTGFRIVQKGLYSAARQCECRLEKLGRNLPAACGIPPAYADKRLDNFEARTPDLKHALACARAYLRMFPAVTPQGLILGGRPGCGKTHLAVAIMRTLVGRRIEARFFDCQRLLETIRAGMDEAREYSETSIIRAASEPHVIVLDDLGGRRPSSWVHDTLFDLLSERLRQNRPTILTTQATDEMFGVEASDGWSLAERIGARARSKVWEMCQPIGISAGDHRLKARAE